jgi:hypothetical protein
LRDAIRAHHPKGHTKVSSYILRKIDDGLWHRVKVKAAQEQTTIKALIERLLSDWLKAKR